MGKMVVHQWYIKKGMFGGNMTGTLCGRESSESEDGTNSGDGADVTCKLCLRQRAAMDARHAREVEDAATRKHKDSTRGDGR